MAHAEQTYSPIFLAAVERTLAHEGGYLKSPAEESNFGISKRSYPELDIARLTRDCAIQIYHHDFWEKFGYGRIDEFAIAAKLFDLAVNAGPESAARFLQRALRACGIGVSEDGILGSATLNAANSYANQTALLAALRSEAASYYRILFEVERAKGLRAGDQFITGWLNRAYA